MNFEESYLGYHSVNNARNKRKNPADIDISLHIKKHIENFFFVNCGPSH